LQAVATNGLQAVVENNAQAVVAHGLQAVVENNAQAAVITPPQKSQQLI